MTRTRDSRSPFRGTDSQISLTFSGMAKTDDFNSDQPGEVETETNGKSVDELCNRL